MLFLLPCLAIVAALPAQIQPSTKVVELDPSDGFGALTGFNASSFINGVSGDSDLQRATCKPEDSCRYYGEEDRGHPMVKVNIYRDIHCSDYIRTLELGSVEPGHWCRGQFQCYGSGRDGGRGLLADLPPVIYMKPIYGYDRKGSRLVITAQPVEDSCPNNVGVPLPVGVLAESDACLSVRGVNRDFGAAFFPCGMDPNEEAIRDGVEERSAHVPDDIGLVSVHRREKDKDENDPTGDYNENGCKAFDLTPKDQWDWDSYLPAVRVSENVGCTTSSHPCSISRSKQFTKTVTTKWSIAPNAQAGGQAFVLAAVDGTFGQDTAWASSSSVTDNFAVDAGQLGYLSYTPHALRVPVKFKDCPDGKERDGNIWFPKKTGGSYRVVVINKD